MEPPTLTEPKSELRKLDAIEEFFWLVDQRLSKAPVLIAEVEGTRAESDWRAGVDRLQKAHGILSARIEKTRGGRPGFVQSDEPIELTIHDLPQDLSLERDMEKALHKRFSLGSGVPLRIQLYQGVDRCVVLLNYHHAMIDGISGLLILRDLLTLVGGGEVGEASQVGSSLADFLGVSDEWSYTDSVPLDVPLDSGAELGAEADELRAHCLRLDADLTRRITEGARAHGVTVHGVVVGALALAAFECSPAWRAGSKQISAPVNARTVLNLPDRPGLQIYMMASTLKDIAGRTIWDLAKQMRAEVTKARSLAAAVESYQGVHQFLIQERTPNEAHALVLPLSGDMMVSNYGAEKIPCRYGDLRLLAVYCGSGAGSPTHQKVDVVTLDGQLSMTVVSQRPINGLLEAAARILKTVLSV